MKNLFARFVYAALLAIFPLTCHAQSTWDGSEVDDFWFNADNWDTGLIPNGATDQAIVGSPSPTIVNATVTLESLTVTSDGILTINPSLNLNLAGGVPTSVTNAGSITALNNTDFRIIDIVNNTGSISIIAGPNLTDLELGVGGATLTGGGTVTLSGATAGINDVSGTQILTIEDQTIQGEGNFGQNTIDVDNQSDNLIHANVDAGTLRLDAVNIFTNAGTIRASNGGIIELRDAGAGDFVNTGGVIEALADSEVQLINEARIVGGVLQSIGSGVVRNLANNSAELEDLTFNGTYIAENNTDTRITGTVNNTGSIAINSTGNLTDLEVADGGATLTGGGTVTLAGAAAGINDVSGTQILTIENQTIEGEGNIGQNTINVDNQSGNLIHANVDAGILTLDASTSFTNAGTIRASGGGIVRLLDAGTTDFVNTGGVIEALAGSEVQFSTNARVVGGVLQSIGTGVVRNLQSISAELEDLTFNGTFIAENNSDTRITGTINNTGSISINAGANPTDLEVGDGGATLTGGGTVTLSGATAGINDVPGTHLLTIEDQTIEGEGNFGQNTIDVDNQSGNLIHANVDGGTLRLDALDFFTNDGTIRASGGGIIELVDGGAGDFANIGGVIEALEGSEVQFSTNSRVVGGVLQSIGTGVVRNLQSISAELEDLTFNGTFIAENNSDTRITGTINNTGSITINAGINPTDLEVAVDGATLTGGGTVTLSGATAGINDVNGTQLLTIEDQTIEGEGNFGQNTINVDNQSSNLIHANVDGGTLRLDALDFFTNAGTIRASGGGIIELVDGGAGDFVNTGGVIEALEGSEVQFSTNARIVGGVLQSIGTGVVRNNASNGAELEDLTFNGSFIAENNSDTRITGIVNNTGSISINSTVNVTDLEVGVGGATLTGGGTITLVGVNAGINDASGTQTLTIDDQTIQGTGDVGRNTMNFILGAAGTITANMPGDVLKVNPLGIVNNGVIRAQNGGRVELTAGVNNANGTIEALGANSIVERISGTVSNIVSNTGTIRGTGGGVLNLIDSVTFDSDVNSNAGVLEFRGLDTNTDIFKDVTNTDPIFGQLSGVGNSSPGDLQSDQFNTNSGTFIVGDGLNFTAGSGFVSGDFSNTGTIVAGLGSRFSAGGFFGGFITGGGGGSTFILAGHHNFVSTGTLAGSGEISNASSIRAPGTSDTTLESYGFITPGDNPGETGTLTLRDQFIFFGDTNVLEIELGDADHDTLNLVTEADVVELNGELEISILAGYSPSAGDSFDVVTAINGLSGVFDTETLPGLATELDWIVNYTANTVTLDIVLTGDYNDDGFVDAADYTVWRDNVGAPAGTLLNDPTGVVISSIQYDNWAANYGATASSSSASASVPEPSTLLLMLASVAAMAKSRRDA